MRRVNWSCALLEDCVVDATGASRCRGSINGVSNHTAASCLTVGRRRHEQLVGRHGVKPSPGAGRCRESPAAFEGGPIEDVDHALPAHDVYAPSFRIDEDIIRVTAGFPLGQDRSVFHRVPDNSRGPAKDGNDRLAVFVERHRIVRAQRWPATTQLAEPQFDR